MSKLSYSSRSNQDPSKSIRPILQSRKQPDPKHSESPLNIQPILKDKKKSATLKKSEEKTKETGLPESNFITYKVQRELRCRNTLQAKTEKKTMKEIEKIQENIRKNPSFHDLNSEYEEKKTVANKTPEARSNFQGFSTFYDENDRIGSIKDKICKRFLEKKSDPLLRNNIEIKQDVNIFDEISSKNENSYDEEKDQNISFENPESFMPEIPFFQYNYSNINYFTGTDLLKDFSSEKQEKEPSPYPGTISVVHELDLWRNSYKVITTKTFEFVPVKLPIIETQVFFSLKKIEVKKNFFFDQEDWNMKPICKILSSQEFQCFKKPNVEIFFEEVPYIEILVIDIEEFTTIEKPHIEILTMNSISIVKQKHLYYADVHKKRFRLANCKPITSFFFKEKSIKNKPNRSSNQLEKNFEKNDPLDSSDKNIGFEDSENTEKFQIFNSSLNEINEETRKINISILENSEMFEKFENSKPEFALGQDNSYLVVNQQPKIEKIHNTESSVLKIQSCFRSYLMKNIVKSLRFTNLRHQRQKESSIFVIATILKSFKLASYFEHWKKSLINSSEVIPRFLNYVSVIIQKNWKGFYTRKYILPQVRRIQWFRMTLKSLVIGWKTRKILSTKRVQNHMKNIRDLKKMISELQNDSENSSKTLLSSMVNQLPNMHSKFIKDFNSLYRTGTWVKLIQKKEQKFAESLGNTLTRSYNKLNITETVSQNRDEMPIRPLQVNFEEVLEDDSAENADTKPKRVFTNFLKRKSQKYLETTERTVNATEATKEIYENSDRNWEGPNESQEELMLDEKKIDGKPKEFLKRKSRTIKPKKIKWKVEKKIDCWVSKDIYAKKIEKGVPESSRNRLSVQELEEIFEEVLRNYVDTTSYLKRFERVAGKTKIPQFKSGSDFLFAYNEENYYGMLENLESHYLQLCNQGLKL